MSFRHTALRVLSYNIHKGFSGGIPKFTLHLMKEQIQKIHPDLIFLQEVHGEHTGHRRRIKNYPVESQIEYLAEKTWPHFSYGKNVVYQEGHHGNAILSKFPIVSWENLDVSQNRFERRGILHAVIDLPNLNLGKSKPVHVLCTHLGLFEMDRKKQLARLIQRAKSHIPDGDPVIAAGDFNDWRRAATSPLAKELELEEAFLRLHGSHAKTFPSWLPALCLDRVYSRGFEVLQAQRLDAPEWSALSDHLPLWVEFVAK